MTACHAVASSGWVGAVPVQGTGRQHRRHELGWFRAIGRLVVQGIVCRDGTRVGGGKQGTGERHPLARPPGVPCAPAACRHPGGGPAASAPGGLRSQDSGGAGCGGIAAGWGCPGSMDRSLSRLLNR